MGTRLSVAANYDIDIVTALGAHPVEEVYGKFPADVVGGGRPSYMGATLDRRKLQRYVNALKQEGIAFNYLLNSSCLGNREWGKRWQRSFMTLLESLQAMGIDRVTVAIPYLLEVIKSRFPELYVRVGIFAQVDTPARARFWEDLGADTITLESFSINRDFDRLRSIRRAVNCDLQLIANHVCLPNCPMQPYHQNGFAHSSNGQKELFIDTCLFRCSATRLRNPALFLKSTWIRPEDCATYEAMGFDAFKLLERGIPSPALLKRVEAYSQGTHPGDLGELLLSYGFKEPPPKKSFWGIRHFFRPTQASPLALLPIFDLAKQQGMMFPVTKRPVVIDNSKIPGDFLDTVSRCGGATNGCNDCRYCDSIASNAVHVDATFRDESLKRFDSVHQGLVLGSTWSV